MTRKKWTCTPRRAAVLLGLVVLWAVVLWVVFAPPSPPPPRRVTHIKERVRARVRKSGDRITVVSTAPKRSHRSLHLVPYADGGWQTCGDKEGYPHVPRALEGGGSIALEAHGSGITEVTFPDLSVHTGPFPRGLHIEQPGRYCVGHAAEGCYHRTSIVTVTDPHRRGTEYGVPPKQHNVFAIPSHLPTDLTVQLVSPSFVPQGEAVPVFVKVISPSAPTGAFTAAPYNMVLQCGEEAVHMHRGVTAVWWRKGPEKGHRAVVGGEGGECEVLGGGKLVGKVSVPLGAEGSQQRSVAWEGDVAEGVVDRGVQIIEVSGKGARITGRVVIHEGVWVRVKKGGVLTVTSSGHLIIAGSDASPVVITGEGGSLWGGVLIEGRVSLSWVIGTLSGGKGRKYRPPGTGSHIPALPMFTTLSGGVLKATNVYLMELHGSGFGLGEGSAAVLEHTVVVGAAQGGECVYCDINITSSYFGSIPSDNAKFVDEDNDGFYFRGGHVVMRDTVVSSTKDDCIDSASSKGHEGGRLEVVGCLLENCLHEGIALSGSDIPSPREVTIVDTVVAHSQQGIEVGYSPRSHVTTVTRCAFVGNEVAVRAGDNYKLRVDGLTTISACVFAANRVDIMALIRKHNGPNPESPLVVDASLLPSSHNATYCGDMQWKGSGNFMYHDRNGRAGDSFVSLENLALNGDVAAAAKEAGLHLWGM